MKKHKPGKGLGNNDSGRYNKFVVWALFIFSFLLYANTISNGYNLDDELVTRGHRLTSQGIKAIPEIFSSPYYQDEQGYAYDYRPVALATFAIEHQFFGEKPGTSHFFNVLIFALTVVIIFITLTRLLSAYNYIIPLGAALLFAAHPIHTEAVASIKNRDELLCLFFGVLSLYAFIKFVRRDNWIIYSLAILFFVLGVLSKRSIISFAVIIPIATAMFIPLSYWRLAYIVLPLSILSAFFSPTMDFNSTASIFAAFVTVPFAIQLIIQDKQRLYETFNRLAEASIRKKDELLEKYTNHNVPQKEYPIILKAFHESVLPWGVITGSIAGLLYLSLIYDIPALAVVSLSVAGVFYILSDKVISGPAILLYTITACFISYFFTIPELPLSVVVIIWLELLFFKRVPPVYLLIAFLPALWFTVQVQTEFYNELIFSFPFIILFILLRYKYVGWVALVLMVLLIDYPERYLVLQNSSDFLRGLLGRRNDIMVVGLLPFFMLRWLISKGRNRFYINEILIAISLIFVSYQVVFEKKPYFEVAIGTEAPVAVEILPEEAETTRDIITGGRDLEYIEFPATDSTTFNQEIGLASIVVGRYLKLLLFPHPLRYYYGYREIEFVDAEYFWAIVSRVAHILLLMIALVFIRRTPLISFGILLYLFSILVFSNILYPVAGIMGERLAYVASLGFCIAVAALLANIFKIDIREARIKLGRLNKSFLGIFAVILVLYSFKAIARNNVWQNHLTLFSHDMEHLEESANAHNLLALHLLRNADNPQYSSQRLEMVQNATEHFKKAIEIYPYYLNFWFDLGRSYIMQNDKEKALAAFKRATEIDPEFPDAWLYAAYALEDLGRNEEAVEYYQKAIQADPQNIDAYVNFTYMYLNGGNLPKALQIAEIAAQQNPQKFQPYVLLAEIYDKMGDKNKAAFYMQQANRLRR